MINYTHNSMVFHKARNLSSRFGQYNVYYTDCYCFLLKFASIIKVLFHTIQISYSTKIIFWINRND